MPPAAAAAAANSAQRATPSAETPRKYGAVVEAKPPGLVKPPPSEYLVPWDEVPVYTPTDLPTLVHGGPGTVPYDKPPSKAKYSALWEYEQYRCVPAQGGWWSVKRGRWWLCLPQQSLPLVGRFGCGRLAFELLCTLRLVHMLAP